jgi:tRNA dimethylallyltransferase
MQIYKGMDIATAKPTAEEMHGIPHHLIDFVDPSESYSVAKYIEDAQTVIQDIFSRGKLPIIVGGTGLYVDSLLGGICFSEQPENESVRAKLTAEAEQYGNEYMHRRLTDIDAEYAKTLHPNNVGRVIRAIELFELTGKTMSQQLVESKTKPSKYNAVTLGIDFEDRQALYDRINLRVDIMLKLGLLEEAKQFYAMHDVKTSAQAIGCKEFLPYFSGEKSLEECVEQLKMQTRRYAKRQLTWFRRNSETHWLYRDKFEDIESFCLAAKKIAEENL